MNLRIVVGLWVLLSSSSVFAQAAPKPGPTGFDGEPSQTGSMYNGRNVSHSQPSTNATVVGQAENGEPASVSGETSRTQGTTGAGIGGTSGGGEQQGGEH